MSLVERLRDPYLCRECGWDWGCAYDSSWDPCEMCSDRLAAADEIERLRAENADLIRSVSDLRAVREQLGTDALADERAHADQLAEALRVALPALDQMHFDGCSPKDGCDCVDQADAAEELLAVHDARRAGEA